MNKTPLILCTKHRIPQKCLNPNGHQYVERRTGTITSPGCWSRTSSASKIPLHQTFPVQVCRLSSAGPEHKSQTKPCHGITHTGKKGGLPGILSAQHRISLQHSPGPSSITTGPRCDRTGKNPERGNSFASTKPPHHPAPKSSEP